MKRHIILATIAMAMAFGPAIADDEEVVSERPTVAFRPAVIDAVDRIIIPGYDTLTAKAAIEAERVSDLCFQADDERLALAREGFGALVLAWSTVEMFRFGPVRDENRYERLFFWPDPRGRGLQQIQRILGGEDASATAVETLRGKSVAVQGLFALEFVLFGTGSNTLADTAAPNRSFRCRYGAAIAGAIARTTRELDEAWKAEDGYAALMRDAGPDNPVYRSHGEVVQELIKSCREQAQLDQQLKLAFTIGATPDKAKPKLAPFWRSNLTIPSIRANLAAVVSLCGPDGIGAILPESADWQAGSLAFEISSADHALAGISRGDTPWESVVADERGHDTLRYVQIPLGGAVELLEQGYPAAFGLITGFNSLDGD